ncbi:hypothetical protein L7F22_058494 [Adiantum nelumboides]|nr:hypothetical protein [Adiantum nelumboides]
MEEAARLRLQAEKEGVHAYLAKPKVRGKPNPQFLKATVTSISQANRAVEVSGMWKRRVRELELEEREQKKSRHRHKSDSSSRCLHRSSHYDHHPQKSTSSKSRVGYRELSPSPRTPNSGGADCRLNDCCNNMPHCGHGVHTQEFEDSVEDQGLKEEEVEFFLQSR